MDSLPTETILHIISFLPKRDLKHYSLVSTRFTPLAQQALFQTVKILSFRGKIPSWAFVDFVDDVIKSPRIGLMIKRLNIGTTFDDHLHYQALVQLLEQVHDLRELLCYSYAFFPTIPFRPHQFPLLQTIAWPLLDPGAEILHTLLPYSPVVDLSLLSCPTPLQSKVAFDALLEHGTPKWVNNLVRYTGTSYLIEGLGEDAKLLHFCSTNSLSEDSLRGLASNRLLSLHVKFEAYGRSPEEHPIPPSLVPSLFPNLQSVMCFAVQPGSNVRYFSQKWKLPANGTLRYCAHFETPRMVL
jgi:hypothetical protein